MLFSILFFALCAFAAPLDTSLAPAGVPSYVVKYAPMVYLHNDDPYRPSDIGTQLVNTQPELNFSVISGAPNPLTLDNLNQLNDYGANSTYLTTKTTISDNLPWKYGVKPNSKHKTPGAVTCAIIVNDHGNGLVDAFYMYFYAFNYGGTYVGFTIGDHIGDWEHNMIRFENGTPQAVWYSQHNNGEAFTYTVTEKYNDDIRPIVYSANGSHANYAIGGTHGHGIPNVNLPDGPINDHTDKGPLWDPTLSAYYYSYDANTQQFSTYDSSTPVNWLYYWGRWGNDQLPTSDPNQDCVLGISALCKWGSGPTGPIDKDLNRTKVCPDNGNLCIVRTILGP